MKLNQEGQCRQFMVNLINMFSIEVAWSSLSTLGRWGVVGQYGHLNGQHSKFFCWMPPSGGKDAFYYFRPIKMCKKKKEKYK